MNSSVIGIDLGTTDSRIAICRNGAFQVLPSIPSFIAFRGDLSEPLFGDEAKKQIISFFLRNLKKIAEENFEIGGEEEYVDCVISVPSVFNDLQRRSLRYAAKLAGLNILRLLNETSAAAINYAVLKGIEQLDLNKLDDHQQLQKRQRIDGEEKIMVFDLGGGSLSVAIIRVKEEDNVKKLIVKSQAGYTHLGGKDVDDLIILHCLNKFSEKNQGIFRHTFTELDRKKDSAKHLASSLSRLRLECERAKIALSSRGQGEETIQVDSFHDTKNLVCTLSFNEFQYITRDLYTKCKTATVQCIKDANLKDAYSVDKVIALGRSTELPGIKHLLESMFSGIVKFQGTDAAVVRGAATQASLLSGNGMIHRVTKNSVLDVIPVDIAIELASGKKTLIKRNTTLPAQVDHLFTTSEEKQTTAVLRVYEKGWDQYYNFLGNFEISKIPPAKKGWPKMKATLMIDRDGILGGTAFDSLDPSTRSPIPVAFPDPFAYTPGYRAYKCSVTIEKGNLSTDDIEVLRQRNSADMY
ncbi:heat shock cognate 70 kDa protein-like [Papaver somniferum]|uniref:heat shock cognate 70 kDa protein-like n=1 Tax=Papaver somniferum TaxID=3469 RepID=UPI000E70371F|nr:heat shock cognate 70 kDa protein-like [Papaver somniferum]